MLIYQDTTEIFVSVYSAQELLPKAVLLLLLKYQ